MHCEIDILRHGMTTAGAVFIGSTNAKLTDSGFTAMNEIMAHSARQYHQVICSPLKRCLDFARHYSKQQHLPLCIHSDLAELRFGLWETKSSELLYKENPIALSKFWHNPFEYTIPEGENMHDFHQRIIAAFTTIVSENMGKNILAVTHAGVISMLLYSLNTAKDKTLFDHQIPHASLTRLQISMEKEKITQSGKAEIIVTT